MWRRDVSEYAVQQVPGNSSMRSLMARNSSRSCTKGAFAPNSNDKSECDSGGNLLLGTPEVQVAERTALQGGGVDGQHILVCQLIIHKVQSQMCIHGLHEVLHIHTYTLACVQQTLVYVGLYFGLHATKGCRFYVYSVSGAGAQRTRSENA